MPVEWYRFATTIGHRRSATARRTQASYTTPRPPCRVGAHRARPPLSSWAE